MFPRGHGPKTVAKKSLNQNHVIYQKMLCKKSFAEISWLQKTTLTGVFMTKNDSVEKIQWPISCSEKVL